MSTEQVANSKVGSEALVDALLDGGTGDEIGEQLFDIAAMFRDSPRLLRSTTDPGRSGTDRVNMVNGLIASRVSGGAEAIVDSLAGLHWANPEDFVFTLRELGVEAELRAAKARGELDRVGQELVAIGHVLIDDRELRTVLSPISGKTVSERQALAKQLFAQHILPCTAVLLNHAVVTATPGRLVQKLRNYARTGADLEGARLVMVRTAVPFTSEQRDRLESLLERQMKQPVTLGVVLDPDLIGGFRISYGNEAYDSSVRADVTKARQALLR